MKIGLRWLAKVWVVTGVAGMAMGQTVPAVSPPAPQSTPAPAVAPAVQAKPPLPKPGTVVPVTPAQVTAMQQKLADWPQLNRYASENAALPPPEKGVQRVVFYGDSITDGWGRRDGTGTFFPGKPYINRGISGQTTPQMVVRFRQDVVDLHPAAVVILAGTNDIAGNTGPMTPEMTEDNFRSMADLAKANGIRVILASITPTSDYPWRPGLHPAPKVKALNTWMEAYCAANGLTYLDYYTPMADADGGMKPGLSFEGVHPNAQGYAIMAPLAEAAIAKALKQ